MTPTSKQVNISDYNPSSYAPGAKRTVFAKSKAYKKMIDELFDYTTGKLKGGSVLISGHRGAGKTTLVNNVINDLTEILAERRISYKPLFVPLHGPDLLDPDRTEKIPPQKSPDTNTPKDATTVQQSEKKMRLKLQVLGPHLNRKNVMKKISRTS